MDRTAATHAALLLSTDSLFMAALAATALKERLPGGLLLALVAGVAGSALVSLHAGGAGASLVGDALVVAAAFAGGAYGVLARSVAPGRDPVVVSTVQMLGASLIAVPLWLGAIASGHTDVGGADAGHLAIAALVGVLGGVVPFLLFNAAIRHITAVRAGLLLVLIPVFALLAAAFVLGETLAPLQLAGAALIVLAAGVAISRGEARPPRRDDPGRRRGAHDVVAVELGECLSGRGVDVRA